MRHALPYLPSCDGLDLMVIAHHANALGRAKITNAEIAAVRGRSERVVRRQTGRMVAEGRFLSRIGWTWILTGYSGHDVDYCDHGDCVKDSVARAEARRRQRAR